MNSQIVCIYKSYFDITLLIYKLLILLLFLAWYGNLLEPLIGGVYRDAESLTPVLTPIDRKVIRIYENLRYYKSPQNVVAQGL